MNEKWYKHSYVCTDCDGLYEITIKSNKSPNPECTEDGQFLTLMSVLDATIYPITQKKEEEMLTETPAQTITLNWIENDVETTKTYTENDIRSAIYNNKQLNNKMNEYYRKESELRTLLQEVYADSSDQDTLAQIANIFDVPLTKEVEVTAWARVDMTIEVDIRDEDCDIEDFVSSNLNVDSYAGEISINNQELEKVELQW